jgi:hypothetical protein
MLVNLTMDGKDDGKQWRSEKSHFLKEWRSLKKKNFFEIFGHEEKNGGYYVAQ